MSWRDYWSGKPAVYVSERHLRAHCALIATDIRAIIGKVEAELGTERTGAGLRVLDFGCGEALAAAEVAKRARHLILCDGSAPVREGLEARFGDDAAVVVLAPEMLAGIEAGSLDLIIVNSVLQYLPRAELGGLLETWRAALAGDGRLLIGDVIPPNQSALGDATSLMRFGWRHGFLLASVGGLVKMAFSDYRRIRAELGLQCYTETEMLALLEAAGYQARRHVPNVGHNQSRMAFIATRRN